MLRANDSQEQDLAQSLAPGGGAFPSFFNTSPPSTQAPGSSGGPGWSPGGSSGASAPAAQAPLQNAAQPANPFLSWIQQNPQMAARLAAAGIPVASLTGQSGPGSVQGLGLEQTPINALGMSNIFDILASNGQIPQQQLNQQISQSNRAGQGVQQGVTANAARLGNQNSGLVQALLAASGQATAGREAGLRAGFANDAETRRRQDIVNMLLPYFGIQLDEDALRSNQYNADRNRSDQRNAAKLSAGVDIGKSIIDAFL